MLPDLLDTPYRVTEMTGLQHLVITARTRALEPAQLVLCLRRFNRRYATGRFHVLFRGLKPTAKFRGRYAAL